MVPAGRAGDRLVTVSISFGDAEAAAEVARELVELRLAACAQFWPMRSVYRWEGGVETAEEYLLEAKTVATRLAEIDIFVRSRHAYDVPEIIARPLLSASEAYGQWVRESVAPER